MAITSGLYEIRSVLLTSMALDVAGGSAIKGANIQLYSANDTNAQKFYIVEESASHWSIQNAQSRLYMDVARGAAANGTNIQQYTDNDTRAQRWNIQDTGNTVTIDGVACPIVVLGSYVAGDGTAWVADVDHAMTTSKTNIQLHSPNGTPAQQFALYPTTLQDAGMPVPSGRGWATTLGAANSQGTQPTQTVLYPCWYFTDAWNGLSEHGFEISYRYRLIESGTATAGSWTAWTAWSAEDVTLYGQTAWLTDGLPATFDTSAYKRMEYALRVRSTSVVNGTRYHSKAITMSLAAVFAPSVACTGAMRVPDALRLTFTSDYTGGTTAVRVTSLTNGSNKYLRKPIMGYGYGPLFTVDIPYSSLSGAALTQTKVNVSYEVGTDQYPATGVTNTDYNVSLTNSPTMTLSVSATPTLVKESRTARIAVSGADSYAAYAYVNGEGVPLAQLGPTTFQVAPAFGTGTEVIVIGTNTAGTAWGSASLTVRTSSKDACHAWNWGESGYLLLDVVDGYMQTSRTMKADYSNFQLNGREWHALSFANSMGGEFSAEGVLKDGLTSGTKQQLMELMKAHNVTYRAPSGEIAHVGITEIQYQTVRGRTTVSVNMVQVTR